MAFFHRKLLCKPDIHDKENSCKPPPRLTLDPQSPSRPTVDPPPPPPPPPPQSFDHQSFSPFLIIMFGGLAVSICFICYLTTCATRYRRRQINLANTDHETYEDFVNEDLGPVVPHPIWLINTIGLDQSQIESIHVFKYKRDEKLIEGTDCSVCLSEFEDDESLRLLPKCSHAFHVPCIDTWLRSHKNCPLCRAPIFIKNTNDDRTDVHATTEPNLIESSTTEQTEPPVNDFETNDDQDHHVVEVENNDEIVKTDLEEELIAMRRSVSNSQLVISKKPSIITKGDHEHRFKGSSSNIHLSGKVTKSSSIRRSLRKASSYTSKSRPYTRSY